jgi:flagellar hook assembly protein FlgD
VELAFTLPVSGYTRLAIYDLSGRRVIALHEGELAAGRHRLFWDGQDDRGRTQPTGVYLVSVQCGAFRERCKIVLAR